MIAAAVISVWNIRLTNQLTPELKIDLKLSDKDCTIELAKAGCWMAFSSISNILIRGLDLTVANVLIGDYEMGILSVARTIPNNVTSVVGTIAPLFTPVFISLYVKKSNTDLINNIKSSIKTMAVILFVPITAFIVFSKDFYTLWQGSLSEEEIMMVTALSTLTVVQAYFNSTTATMAQVSVVVNKLKSPVLVSFFVGLISFVVEIVLIKNGVSLSLSQLLISKYPECISVNTSTNTMAFHSDLIEKMEANNENEILVFEAKMNMY